ncbi:MAG: guanylate kinase [Clostridiaceae bacterium]|jgi:guanylate kinase|nr:guanylate kinase [Oscillospiraceae bacterium]NLO62333.1 guanylate kinase [Clostridiaceae bacterium]
MSESAEQTEQLRKGLLVSVSGPSGVGKGTVIERVRMRIPDIAHSISVTSRPRRDCETDGVEYFFRSDKEFKRMMAKGEILEFDIYLNNYYGTPVKPLEKLVGEGKDVLFDLTVSGSLALKEKFPESVTIFLLPPSVSDLRDRLVRRGTETIDVIERRLLEASVEIPKADLFDYVVINDDLERASNRIIAIIEAEKHRYFRQIGIEDRILNG